MQEVLRLEAFPHSTLVKDAEEMARQGRESVEWLRTLGVSKPADRYHSYLRAIESFGELKGDESAIIKNFDSFVNANAELYELNRVRTTLLKVDSQSYLDTLKRISQGQPFRHHAESDPGRDYLFEMSIASRLLNAGHEVDLNQIADVVAQVNGRRIYIEAKRIKSSGKLASRVSEANKQLKKRLAQDSSSTSRGIVAVNITDVISPDCATVVIHEENLIRYQHSEVFNGFITDNPKLFHKGEHTKCLGAFIESSWQGLISDTETEPKLFFCRGATFKLYRVSQSEDIFVRGFIPNLANQLY